MWRDLSVTTLPTPINAYEQYKPLNGNGIISGGGGGGKWNQPGNRSSYSLPHPAHVQSNQRWQHYAAEPPPPHHLQQRPLSHSPSYPHIPSSVISNGHGVGSGGGGQMPHHQVRSRPVSMYDMPSYTSQQPHSFSSFMAAGPPPPSQSKMMMQNAKHHHSHQMQQHQQHHQSQHYINGNSIESKGGGDRNGALHLRQKPGELVRDTRFIILFYEGWNWNWIFGIRKHAWLWLNFVSFHLWTLKMDSYQWTNRSIQKLTSSITYLKSIKEYWATRRLNESKSDLNIWRDSWFDVNYCTRLIQLNFASFAWVNKGAVNCGTLLRLQVKTLPVHCMQTSTVGHQPYFMSFSLSIFLSSFGVNASSSSSSVLSQFNRSYQSLLQNLLKLQVNNAEITTTSHNLSSSIPRTPTFSCVSLRQFAHEYTYSSPQFSLNQNSFV